MICTGGDRKKNNLSDVKKANRQLVYECIWSHKSVTMTDLAYVTHLSRPTITSLVQEMTADNLVIKSGYGTSNGGRNPVLYHANVNAAYAMGIDLEFPKVRMAISNLECENICFSVRIYPKDADKDQVLQLMKQQIDDLLLESGIDKNRLLGVGIGVPGVIDYKNNYSVFFERINGWENVLIGDIIQEYIGKPVYICNDVNLISWAERKVAHLEDIKNMLYIIIRSGIGMAIWNDGSLMQGEMGNSGRIGHMTVDKNGLQCKCGNRGCLGLYTSEKSMIRMYGELTGKELKWAGELFPLAEAGDAAALQVFETCGRYLGTGIVNVANLFDISEVVLSTSFDSSYILKSAQYALDARKMNTIRREVKVRKGLLQESSFGLGGCLLVLNKEHMSLLEG